MIDKEGESETVGVCEFEMIGELDTEVELRH